MSEGFVNYKIEGVDGVISKLKRLIAPDVYMRGLRKIGQAIIDEAAWYPPVNHVTRKQAYGSTFQSERQRRWFFAALRAGQLQIPYRRTGETRRGWRLVDGNMTINVTNDTEGAKWAHGENTQARQLHLVGWRKQSAILETINKRGVAVKIMSEEIQSEINK